MPSPMTVLFVCLHGSAKSVIAAELLRRRAAARGLVVDCAAAGVEPDAAIPPHVVTGLGAEGLDVSATRPQPVTAELIAGARYVVSFGGDLSAFGTGADIVRRWDDVPAVSDGYAAARDAIVRRLDAFINEIADSARPAAEG